MSVRAWMIGLTLIGISWTSFMPTQATDKPPDLPVAQDVGSPKPDDTGPHGSISIGLDLLSGKLSVRVQLNKKNQQCDETPCVDGFCPFVFECFRKLLTDVIERRRAATESSRLESCADRCGAVARIRNSRSDAPSVRRALEVETSDVDSRADGDGAGEQEPPLIRSPMREKPNQDRHRDMLKQTKQLGTAPVDLFWPHS